MGPKICRADFWCSIDNITFWELIPIAVKRSGDIFLANYLTNFANNILAPHKSRNVVTNLFAPFVFGHRLIEANYLRASPAGPRDSFVYFAIPSIDIDRCWRPAKCIHLRSFRYQIGNGLTTRKSKDTEPSLQKEPFAVFV